MAVKRGSNNFRVTIAQADKSSRLRYSSYPPAKHDTAGQFRELEFESSTYDEGTDAGKPTSGLLIVRSPPSPSLSGKPISKIPNQIMPDGTHLELLPSCIPNGPNLPEVHPTRLAAAIYMRTSLWLGCSPSNIAATALRASERALEPSEQQHLVRCRICD